MSANHSVAERPHQCAKFVILQKIQRNLKSMGVFPQQIIKGSEFFMWDIVLSISEEYMAVVGRELITNDLILRTEYGRK